MHVTTVPITMMFNAGQARWLREHGWTVHAACAEGPLLNRYADETGAAVHAIPMSRRIEPAADARAILDLVRLMHQVRPDVVHAQSPKGALLGLSAARIAGVPARFYGVLGLPSVTARGVTRQLLLNSDRLACALAHRALCVSHSVRDGLVNNGLCSAAKAVVLGEGSVSGIDAITRFTPAAAQPLLDGLRARWRLPDRVPVVGFVGRLEREKGIGELWLAYQRVRHAFPRTHLLMLGNAEAKDPISGDLLDTIANDPQARWVREYVSEAELAAAFSLMDIVVLPSYREGYPSVLLEAAAMSRPAVASRVPGCSDAIIDGVTGTLVPVRTVEPLAEAIVAYLRDPALRQAHGMAARERALRSFSPERIWRATLAEYERVLHVSTSQPHSFAS